jgi:WD40 repeat protein
VLNPVKEQIIAGSTSGDIFIYDLNNPGAAPTNILREHTEGIKSLSLSHSSQILVSLSDDRTVRVWDLNNIADSATVLDMAGVPTNNLGAVETDTNGLKVILVGEYVLIWDLSVSTNKPVILNGHTGRVVNVAFEPNQSYFITVGSDKEIRSWQWPTTLEELMTIACQTVNRDLTETEWETYIGDNRPYQPTCG